MIRSGRILLAAAQARRARARRDPEACRRQMLATLALALPGGVPAGRGGFGRLPGAIADCAPMPNATGGFFSCLATGAGSERYFVKGILAHGREAKFWQAWRAGQVREAGRHYRIVPPVAIHQGAAVCVLVFPAHDFMKTDFRTRDGRFARNVRRVARALADFNSDHSGTRGLAATRAAAPVRVPRATAVAAALGIETAAAEAAVARLRAVEAGWAAACRRLLGGAPRCLAHLDLGPSNVVFHDGAAVLMDFGHAAAAPVGADLHTVLRYAGRPDAAEELVAIYVEVFAAKGTPVDVAAVRRALAAHFGARYRNTRLRSARDPAVFAAALASSEAFVAEAGAPV